jgi:AcrR family transcriptional regulator
MTRVVKEPDIRRGEIVSAAMELFNLKGYDKATINEIIRKAGIAKGTFYYYFKSKEEVLDAIVKGYISATIRTASEIAQNKIINAPEKIKRMITEYNNQINMNHDTHVHLHNIKNVDMHQKMIVEAVLQYAPIFASVIEQGVREEFFETAYPLEIAQYLIVSINFLLDPGIFKWTFEEFVKKVKALGIMLERLLNAEKGGFDYISEILINTGLNPDFSKNTNRGKK